MIPGRSVHTLNDLRAAFTGSYPTRLPAELYDRAQREGFEMVGYERGLVTDEMKHEDCIQRTGHPAVFLSPSIYDAAERAGHGMRGYVKQRPIPVTGSGTVRESSVHFLRRVLGDDMRSVQERLRGPTKKPSRPVRKHVSEKYCGGIACMPGLNGKCVACGDDK